MRLNKKAALELSITAIVVLIIAITVLGLSIGFIKKQFGGSGKILEEQLASIKQKLRDDIRTGGDLLVFSVPDQVNVGKPSGIVIGVRNTAQNTDGDRICFRVEVSCIKPFTPNTPCVSDQPGPPFETVAVGGYDAVNNDFVAGNHNWFKSILGQFDLKNFEGDVYDAILLVRAVKPDSYQMEINVYKEPNDKACKDQGFSDPAKNYTRANHSS